METRIQSKSRMKQRLVDQRGFTMVEMLIIVALIATLSTFAFMGIVEARAKMRLSSSARQFAAYLEKARGDAVRRHGTATVRMLGSGGATSYEVTMDFDGDGTVETSETRTFSLEDGIRFTNSATTVTFDWRGRTGKQEVFQLQYGNNDDDESTQIPIDVTGSGDITLANEKFLDSEIPTVTLNTSVSGDTTPDAPPGAPTTPPSPPPAPPNPPPSDPAPPSPPDPVPPSPPSPPAPPAPPSPPSPPDPVPPSPPSPPSPPAPPSPPDPVPPSPPPPSPPAPVCGMTLSTGSLSLSQGNPSGRTGTVTVTLANTGGGSRTITATGTNLTISVSPSSVSGDGSTIVTITAKSGIGNRGTFTVSISADPACGSTQTVSVTVN